MGEGRRIAAALVALTGALAWTQPPASGADLWWHLAAGRQIWERGGPPSTDSFSFTAQGHEWLNHEWLWDALAWGVYRWTPDALAWAQLALLAGLFALLWRTARGASESNLATGAALWLAAATSHWFFEVRPNTVTLLLLAALMATRDWRGRLWLWPLLTALWANLHGGFVFGIGAVALLALVRTFERSRAEGRLAPPALDAATAALCALAWLANPWGARSLDYPLQYLDASSPFRNILEWHAPGLSVDPRDYAGRFAWMAALAALGLPRALRRAPGLAALAAVTFAMAVTSRRFIPLFAVSAAPLVALAIAPAVQASTRRWRRLDSPAAVWGATAACALATALLWRDVRLGPDLLGRWTLRDRFPAAAVRYLEALGPPERLLNDYTWGGYVMLELPGSRVFLDGRANTVYDDAQFLDARALRQLEEGWAERLERLRPDAALLKREALAQALANAARPWTVAYQDASALVLLPPDSPLIPRAAATLESLLAEPVFYEERARRALVGGEIAESVRAVEAELARNPGDVAAWAQLALLEAARGDAEAATRALEAGRRANPRRTRDLSSAAAAVYERLGDPARAASARRRAAPRGPFDGAPAAESGGGP